MRCLDVEATAFRAARGVPDDEGDERCMRLGEDGTLSYTSERVESRLLAATGACPLVVMDRLLLLKKEPVGRAYIS